jgi:hypothetical protein
MIDTGYIGERIAEVVDDLKRRGEDLLDRAHAIEDAWRAWDAAELMRLGAVSRSMADAMDALPNVPEARGREAHGREMSPAEHARYERDRQEAIRRNKSRRARGLPTEPNPPRIEPPTKVQLSTRGGEYIGTWDWGVSPEQAVDEAVGHGFSADDIVVKLVRA